MQDLRSILDDARETQSFFLDLGKMLGMDVRAPVSPEMARRIRKRAVELLTKNNELRRELACLKRSSSS